MLVEQHHIQTELRPILMNVFDPEIPVLTIVDMGVVRSAVLENNVAKIEITPTYSGCPAMDVIGDDLKIAFAPLGKKVKVELVLAPAWSTDWISESGLQKMEAYGIARPLSESADKDVLLAGAKKVICPQCKSTDTHLVSQFGSTACKALFKCEACLEPFDYFKCLK